MRTKIKSGMKWSALLLCVNAAYAADDATAERIMQLQKLIEQQQQQIGAMASELKELQQATAAKKGKSIGSPMYAAFKNGVTFQDEGGNWKLAINGRVQADYRAFRPDESAADTFSVRRARLGATMTFYRDLSARVEGEYSASSTSLTYGYLDFNRWAAAKVRLGQFKPFYGLERTTSSNFTDFQERSLADALLGGTFDRGVMVHGAPTRGVYYSAAYINGTNNGDEADVKTDNKETLNKS